MLDQFGAQISQKKLLSENKTAFFYFYFRKFKDSRKNY